jgi:signal peptidase I
MLKKLGAFFLDIIEVVVFAVAIFLFVYLLILQPHKIKGDSMQPNFPDGEFLLADKITYRLREPKRGDVIVFQAPVAPDEEYIKRIIGLPGESVKVLSGRDIFILMTNS